MATNLYARLVAGEDERTEALADLLERVLGSDCAKKTRRFEDFVARVLLANPTNEDWKTAFVRSANGSPAAFSVVTQYRVSDGTIPDMVIFKGSDPVCVVEVKIDAEIGEGQLERYGIWLDERASDGCEPALVLLTQSTNAPEGFTHPEIECYRVRLRSVALWHIVANWFGELCRSEDGVAEPLKSLARDFSEFLKEDAMPTLDDAAIARLYLAQSHRKLIDTVRNMPARFEFPHHWSAGRGVEVNPVGIWKYHYPEDDHNTRFVYYGLCFNPADENDNALHGFARYENGAVDDPKPVVIGDGFYAFVGICALAEDCRYIPGFANNRWYERPRGVLVESKDGPSVDSTGWWHYSTGDKAGYARVRALQDVLEDDGRVGGRLERWTHNALSQAVDLWKDHFGAGA